MKPFWKYVLYSFVGAIIFLLVASLFFGSFGHKVSNLIKDVNDKQELKQSIVEVDGEELQTVNPTFVFDRFKNITYNLNYEEDANSDYIVANFKDNSGYFNTKCYKIIYRTAKEDIFLCKECTNKTSEKIYCSIHQLTEIKVNGILIGSFTAENPLGSGFSSIGTDMELNKLIEDYWKDKGYSI